MIGPWSLHVYFINPVVYLQFVIGWFYIIHTRTTTTKKGNEERKEEPYELWGHRGRDSLQG